MPRGRSYPAISLPEAITKAEALYEQEGGALTTPDVAVKAWGYSSLNGASLRIIAALRQYGLLADVGDQTKLSDRALAIVLEPEDSEERRNAIQEAAEEPTIFQEILNAHPGGLPSDMSLKSFLIRNNDFGFKESAAEKLIAALRETLDFTERVERTYIASPPDPREREPRPPSGAKRVTTTQMLQTPIRLSTSKQAILTTPIEMDEEEIHKLRRYLDFWLDFTEGKLPPDTPGDGAESGESDDNEPTE